MSLTRARLAADAGTQLLMAIPEGWAVSLYNLKADGYYWAELDRSKPKLELKAWQAPFPQFEKLPTEGSPWGTICEVSHILAKGYPRIDLTIEHKD